MSQPPEAAAQLWIVRPLHPMNQHSHTGSLSTARTGSGDLDYVEEDRSIPFGFRMGAGAVLVCIYRPVAIEWHQKNAWAVDRKREITDLVVAYLPTKLPAFRVTFDTEAILALRRVDETGA